MQSPTQTVTASLIRNVVYPLWARREHPAYSSYLREFEASQSLPREELNILQAMRLSALLTHAYESCPFYRERMKAAGLHPDSFSDTNALVMLPVLTKRDIQEHGAEMCARGFPEAQRVRNQTGGSTGSPLQFWVDRRRLDSRMASTARHNRWAGLRPGDWCAEIWGNRLDQNVSDSWWDQLRNRLIYRVEELNTSSFSSRQWAQFVLRLRQRRPRFMVAYANSAAMFARWLHQEGITDIRFDSVITTAEVLFPQDREIIEETLGAKVFNRYGCREVSVIASECEYHRGLHVNAEALLVEIVANPLYESGSGKVVITDLLNYSMPLIRYEIGDVSSWAKDQDCQCGRQLPLLDEVHGRTTDFLVLADGRMISGPALTLVVSDMKDVSQVQFVQQSTNRIAVKVVPGRLFDADTSRELRKRLGLYLKGTAQVSLEIVQSIPSEASGKFRFVINNVAEQAPAQAESSHVGPH